METVRTQAVSVNDLGWKIDYRPERCALCGSCVAGCTFNALEVSVVRAGCAVSRDSTPNPQREYVARPVIRQKNAVATACVGCGMCEKTCPNGAIAPVRNPDSRFPLLARERGPIKRGGRTNLNSQRTLDAIIVGRISQMTDPALDSERHTFDMRSPFGRVMQARDLPLRAEGDALVLTEKMPPVHWIYPAIFSDMSIGALSTRAWEAVALSTAYLNEKCGLPVRMCSGEGGMPVKLLESEQLKYVILQIASGHFGWNRIIKAMPRMKTDPAGVLIKIGQGAKPGDGGLLPAAKVAPHIQAIRGVPKATLHSPPNHQGLYSIEEAVQKMHLSLNAAFGFRVPVAIKCAASATSVSVYNNLLRDPYKICGGFVLDGVQGGTGAANEVSLDHTGHPIVSKLRDCYLAAVSQGAQGQIPLWAGGGIGMSGNAAADAFKMLCLGANGVILGKILIQLLGCIGNERGRCNSCSTGLCPTGICTQDPRLVKRLDVDKGARNIVDYMLAFDSELRKLLAPVGNSSLPVGRSDALVSTCRAIADKLGIQYAC
ncbi:MAG: glutamate synthase (NADPH-GOGAT) subunit 2 [Candidatus Desulfovibrio kirbyi]|jgi:glutamate synthase (NADPH/NADH) large chain|uniref:glutamate synthase (NADPH) n=1 Tax=Candidatus Desulfovibrio kirbyi TaxID=2696086 RepID=A0A6L2R5E0_9BACT|nr:4Fe-4S binding protein [Desulfovibrio sp.]GFH62767.1 MAG: glutamate synthase (NADPH-GOGAT) subunit 2 [Candidatus Desulfovibrio kirbyi]